MVEISSCALSSWTVYLVPWTCLELTCVFTVQAYHRWTQFVSGTGGSHQATPLYACLSKNRTGSSGFHHITCIWLCPSQSKFGSRSSRSYRQNILARIRLISIIAKLDHQISHYFIQKINVETDFWPRHPRGPSENGWLASFTSVEPWSSHLSGLNFIGSEKYSSLCVTVQALVYISACFDMLLVHDSLPSVG